MKGWGEDSVVQENETERGSRVSEPRHETETQDMSAGTLPPLKRDALTRDTNNKTGTWQHKNMTTQDWHTTTDKTRKIKTQRQRGEGGRGAKPFPAGKPRQSQVSSEGQEGWTREAQAVQESQQGARAEPEGRSRGATAKQEPWRMARAGLEGQSREAPAKQPPWRMARKGPNGRSRWAPAKQEPWRMARAGLEGQTRQVLARQEARAQPAAWQAARVAPAGQEAWGWCRPGKELELGQHWQSKELELGRRWQGKELGWLRDGLLDSRVLWSKLCGLADWSGLWSGLCGLSDCKAAFI